MSTGNEYPTADAPSQPGGSDTPVRLRPKAENISRLRRESDKSVRPTDTRPRQLLRRGYSHWAVLAFLVAFTLLLIVVCYYFLYPALDAARDADKAGQKKLAATSWLILSVVLFILVSGLLLTFRIGRFFFPRPTPKRSQTTYIDAWSESAKRLQIPDEDEEEGPL